MATRGVTQSPRYLRHHGRPVLAIWGFGFADRPATTALAQEAIAWFRQSAPAEQRVTLLCGVPRTWRDEATWAPVLRGFDILSPWTVGAYADQPPAWEAPFVPLDGDGEEIPADFYLRLAREGGRRLRGERPLHPSRPIVP